LAFAEQAASEGAQIVIASSNPERVQKAIDALNGNAQGHTLDLTDEQAVETLFTRLARSISGASGGVVGRKLPDAG
jgi:NAD(P)-dependent dehydrogenase (short-subunit alcohol dehydrogenase family)